MSIFDMNVQGKVSKETKTNCGVGNEGEGGIEGNRILCPVHIQNETFRSR